MENYKDPSHLIQYGHLNGRFRKTRKKVPILFKYLQKKIIQDFITQSKNLLPAFRIWLQSQWFLGEQSKEAYVFLHFFRFPKPFHDIPILEVLKLTDRGWFHR